MNLLRMEKMNKAFNRIYVLRDIDLHVDKGEIVALLGENGAGKSTLMKLLAGIHDPTSGSIYLKGEKVEINGPKHSQRLGISIIHQEFNLLRELSIAENLHIGSYLTKGGGRIDWKAMNDHTKEMLERVGLSRLDPKTLIKNCSIAEQQLIEIAKALSVEAEILIMDEPTATLNNEETERLLTLMEELRQQELGIIFITHRLDEVIQGATRFEVIRDGEYIGGAEVEGHTKDEIVTMMVGRRLSDMFPERVKQYGDPLLEVEHLHVKNKLEDIHFTVHEGEILGIAGLVGSGKTELSKALFGMQKLESGRVIMAGKDIQTPKEAIDAGIALVTDDRKEEGLILDLSVAENLLLPSYRKIASYGRLNKKKMKDIVDRWFSGLSIKASSPQVEVRTLSGGNQQKVVLGKWLQMDPKLLILNEPTRGIDIGAKQEIYKIIKDLSAEGIAVILISSEMPEILGMAHRVLVMHDGRLTGEMEIEDATQEKIFQYAVGGDPHGN
ncbi:sugar ABC transporter ATP-binding protein [Alkalicoccus chagannorensis]|uniref:sugar ABC transporter ATP-binding protein n=1 Tax=Alkalicoccus chagannorensis TaxID=427072 RepID=UPI0003FE7CAD|nr:sugar ABC transporter ATP-binding protein [Alkalicoccus chagannorensis]